MRNDLHRFLVGVNNIRYLPENGVFFWSYGAHQDLHFFPTRRSSDPRGGAVAGAVLGGAEKRAALQRDETRGAHARSEEHTSELQSPYDLVCRLLLEKKKS